MAVTEDYRAALGWVSDRRAEVFEMGRPSNVAVNDQGRAGLRCMLADLGLEPRSPDQLRAAFVGAYVLAASGLSDVAMDLPVVQRVLEVLGLFADLVLEE